MKILAEIHKDKVCLMHNHRYIGKVNGRAIEIKPWHDSGEWRIAIKDPNHDGLYSGFLYVDLIQRGD